ncbi:hypothetical protein [Nocardia concava]|uniref:hypothetical protein n=1 Tax=Nocardia concava TaxID=257281 RepID=UPI000594B428|nr:hypothetical protein [Nocardia concava]
MWIVLLGIYAMYFLYVGVTGVHDPGEGAQSRLLWAAVCLSSALGFAAAARWIHRRGTPEARPWGEGLRNALSWALTWLLANLSFSFLVPLIIPRHSADLPWYLHLVASSTGIALALAAAAAAIWVRQKTRTVRLAGAPSTVADLNG